jgi:hypothetical protein
MHIRAAGGGGGSTPRPTPPWMPLFTRNDGYGTVSGTWTKTTNASNLTWYGLVSANNGDYVEWPVWLEAGTYQLDASHFKSSSFGIMSITLDGGQAFDFDTYSAVDPGCSFYTSNIGSFTVGSTGIHTLRATVTNRKNGASSGFNIGLHAIYLRGSCIGLIPWPMGDVPAKINPASAFQDNYKSWTLYSPEFADANLGSNTEAGLSSTVANIITTPYDFHTHASGTWIESQVYIPAGTYTFDFMGLLGTTQGVHQLTINGTPVGTPQAAGTVRLGGIGMAPSAPGNGNIGGSALSTGHIDCYDTCDPVNFMVHDGGKAQDGCIPNALTNIVVASDGWKAVRLTCVGKNSASLNFDIAAAGWFRRTA